MFIQRWIESGLHLSREGSVVQRRLSEQLLELGVLILKRLQPSGIGYVEAAVSGLPVVEGGAAHPVLAADVGRLRTRLLLAQDVLP